MTDIEINQSGPSVEEGVSIDTIWSLPKSIGECDTLVWQMKSNAIWEGLFLYRIEGLHKKQNEESCKNSYLGLVPAKEGVLKEQTIQQQSWFTPTLLFMFVLYGWIFSACSKYLFQEVKEFFYPKSRNDLFTTSEVDISRLKIVLHILSVLSTSLFCYFSLSFLFYRVYTSFVYSLISIISVILIYVVFKLLMMRLITYIFYNDEVWRMVRRSYSTLTCTLSYGLFFVSVVVAYAQPTISLTALYVGLGMCILAIFLYVYKILSIFFTGITSIFYLILYLCTLEILPSIVLVLGLMSIM